MTSDRGVLSKLEWIQALGERRDQYCALSRAQLWLQGRIEYHCSDIPDNRRLGIDDIVNIIHRQTRQEVAERTQYRGGGVMYSDYISQYGSVASEAWEFGRQLVAICRHIGGDNVGNAVHSLVMADRSAIWRYTLDFLADVYAPLHSRIDEALQNEDKITFYLGKVKVVAAPLGFGRAWLSLSREYRQGGNKHKVVIALSGGELTADGSKLGLNGASGPSLAAVLQTLEIATSAYLALDEDGKDALFAEYRVSVDA